MMNGKIHIISTGGTISALKSKNNFAQLGKVSSEELAKGLIIPENCSLEFYQVSAVDSSLMSFTILRQIAAYINTVFQDCETIGAVVCHGTDTLEESAYFLSLCCSEKYRKPVIVTGSQRSSNETGTDAYSNLQDAVWAACSSQTRDIGTAVLFNQALFMPKYVHKSHTHFLHAFTVQHFGMLGTVDQGQVHIVQLPKFSEHYVPVYDFPCIEIYKASLDCSGDVLCYYAQTGCKAVIIEAFGRGNVTAKLAENIKKLAETQCLVLICSDCAGGSVSPCYEFEGGLGKLMEYGAIPAYDYSAKKARIKLAVLLAAGIEDKERIKSLFTG